MTDDAMLIGALAIGLPVSAACLFVAEYLRRYGEPRPTADGKLRPWAQRFVDWLNSRCERGWKKFLSHTALTIFLTGEQNEHHD